MMIRSHSLFLLLTALSGGIVLAESGLLSVSFWPLFSVFILMTAAAFIPKKSLFVVTSTLFWFLYGSFVAVYTLSTMQDRATIRHYFSNSPVIVEGIIAARPLRLPDGMRMEIDVEKLHFGEVDVTAAGRVQLSINSGHSSLLRGDRVRFRSALARPLKLGLPGEFDYPAYLKRRGITALARVSDGGQLLLMSQAEVPSVLRYLDLFAQKAVNHIHESIADPADAAVVSSLLVGGQQEIPADLLSAYSRAGVSHILSISGFHLAVLAFTAAGILSFFLIRFEWFALRWQVRQFALLATLPLMVAYLFFTGAAPATARSVLMLGSVIIAMFMERETDPINGLILAAFVLLLIDPMVLFDLSFQLTFLSLWGVVLLVPLITKRLPEIRNRYLQQLTVFAATSFAAAISTAIPVLIVFHQASLSGLIANILIVPLLGYGAVVTGAFGLLLLPVLPSVSSLVFRFDGILVSISNYFIKLVAKLPVMQSFSLVSHDLLVLVLFLALLTFVADRRVKIAAVLVIISVEIMLHLNMPVRDEGRIKVTFLSVGQGDSTLISFPDGRNMLIDGGGYLFDNGRDFGSRYLLPALNSMGVRRIEYLVLTHPHPDHIGGLQAVADNIEIGQFWYNGCSDGEAVKRLLSSLEKRHVAVRTVKAGFKENRSDGSKVCVYAPGGLSDGCGGNEMDANDDSVVLGVEYQGFRALFMADAGFSVEENLGNMVVSPVTVLKVGHHGSKTSTSTQFLELVRPKFAVISVGERNRFRLPSEITLERVAASGAAILRTDQHGTVTVSSNGQDHWLLLSKQGAAGKLFDMKTSSGLHF